MVHILLNSQKQDVKYRRFFLKEVRVRVLIFKNISVVPLSFNSLCYTVIPPNGFLFYLKKILVRIILYFNVFTIITGYKVNK